ncbi:MAG: hypothetical protein K8T90_07570 [Planctomycetes bacterium]|nr:hypothetical protein [Planctomycetota bacterium]
MFFIVWRGNGLMALPVLIATALPALAFYGGRHASVGVMLSGIVAFLGGLLCVRFGRRWNAVEVQHTLYWLAPERWGYGYVALGVVLWCAGAVGLVQRLLA